MESNPYVYPHNIYLVLAITYLIIEFQTQIYRNSGTYQDLYHPNQVLHRPAKLYVLPNTYYYGM
jgi:hypothetical protein